MVLAALLEGRTLEVTAQIRLGETGTPAADGRCRAKVGKRATPRLGIAHAVTPGCVSL